MEMRRESGANEEELPPPVQRRRHRRAPFEKSRMASSTGTGPTSPGRHSPNPAGPSRPQRLFSARIFSASHGRSPFSQGNSEVPMPSGSLESDQPPANAPIAQRLSSNRRVHLAKMEEDEWSDIEPEVEQRTGDELSDIEDIELGGELEQELANPGMAYGQRRGSQQHSSPSDEGRPPAKPKVPQRFHRRRWNVEGKRPDRLEEGAGHGGLRPDAQMDSGQRAFSPALDVQLAPQPERKESHSSIKSLAAAILSPRRRRTSSRAPSQGEEAEGRGGRNKSSTQNGSVGGVPPGISVPTPPHITVSSPREEPKPAASSPHQPRQQQQMNPSLIKGLSKSISRFRARNRVLDADALEQANFMSKFGMSGAGIQPGTVGIEGQPDQAGSRGGGKWLSNLVFDTNENYFYHWIALISTAYVYNLLVVVARCVFVELAAGRLWMLWLAMDLLMDSVYLADMFVRSRTGYLEQGLLVRDCAKIRKLYFRSRQFLWDCASMLPLDHFCWFLLWQQQPILRMNRLFRKDRIQRFMEQTETRTSMPNAFRVGVVVWYIAVIIHWNACFYFSISEWIGLGSDPWVYGLQNKQSLPEGINDTLTRRYIYSFYWSTLILTTIGEVPGPQQNVEYAFVTVDLMCGVLIFATIVGNVGSMISNISAGRTDFQNRIDSIKQYMDLRGVGKQLEVRVIKWFDYLWANKQGLTDAQVLKVLPDKLQAEIAMHVHFETLRKVRIFQDCEAGLLAELVLKLQLQVFSPGDYVCRKGDIGREMYIVKRGMLQVVADDGLKVFATLSEGAVFGELSILNIAGSKNGNRRTANVRSVGYTDLFVLNKDDLWIALREYPEARKILINKGRELLRKDNLLDENAPEEQKSAEELSEELQSAVRILQIRIARLLAEHTNTDTKLRERIAYLEGKLSKYRALEGEREGGEREPD